MDRDKILTRQTKHQMDANFGTLIAHDLPVQKNGS
jgi:hypothetical protein